MRCACPFCGDFMPQAQGEPRCICPHCGYECAACMGTARPLSVEDIRKLADTGEFESEQEPKPQ